MCQNGATFLPVNYCFSERVGRVQCGHRHSQQSLNHYTSNHGYTNQMLYIIVRSKNQLFLMKLVLGLYYTNTLSSISIVLAH